MTTQKQKAIWQKKTDYLYQVAKWLYNNRKELRRKSDHEFEVFDCPDYMGMPKELANHMNSGLVDIIQDNWELIYSNSWNVFCDWVLFQ